ncbi:MAG: hypothetical protein DMF82_12960 [Acidobacteria bacterium]|nr:MAG: hypothetical protein DMF82_12960 [Acidobacteriota bacterium]
MSDPAAAALTIDSCAPPGRPRASRPACAPRKVSCLSTITVSLYVPAPTKMMSPADAAATAAPMVPWAT